MNPFLLYNLYNHSWVPATFHGTGDALLYTKNMDPKPVYGEMLKVLKK